MDVMDFKTQVTLNGFDIFLSQSSSPGYEFCLLRLDEIDWELLHFTTLRR